MLIIIYVSATTISVFLVLLSITIRLCVDTSEANPHTTTQERGKKLIVPF